MRGRNVISTPQHTQTHNTHTHTFLFSSLFIIHHSAISKPHCSSIQTCFFLRFFSEDIRRECKCGVWAVCVCTVNIKQCLLQGFCICMKDEAVGFGCNRCFSVTHTETNILGVQLMEGLQGGLNQDIKKFCCFVLLCRTKLLTYPKLASNPSTSKLYASCLLFVN